MSAAQCASKRKIINHMFAFRGTAFLCAVVCGFFLHCDLWLYVSFARPLACLLRFLLCSLTLYMGFCFGVDQRPVFFVLFNRRFFVCLLVGELSPQNMYWLPGNEPYIDIEKSNSILHCILHLLVTLSCPPACQASNIPWELTNLRVVVLLARWRMRRPAARRSHKHIAATRGSILECI